MNDKPTIENLRCLIMAAEGTVGYDNEHELIKELLTMCEEHGFGRVSQLAGAIEEIWRYPERQKAYILIRENYLRTMEDARKADINE